MKIVDGVVVSNSTTLPNNTAIKGTAFTSALNEDWNVPILSPLFAHATNGMPMSTVNLISLVMAIPATVLYKAVYNKAPFATDADLAAHTGLEVSQNSFARIINNTIEHNGQNGIFVLGSSSAHIGVLGTGDKAAQPNVIEVRFKNCVAFTGAVVTARFRQS